LGQQNVEYYNQDSIQDHHRKRSENLARKKYVYDHYRVGEKVKMEQWKHAYLLEETFCTENCEIVDWIWMKTNGLLKGQKVGDSIDLNIMATEYNIYNVNNYITQRATWSEVEW